MSFFSRFGRLWLDFLFPKKPPIVHLESLSTEEMMRVLPRASEEPKGDIVTLFDYKDEMVKELIWELKYGGNRSVADKFGEILYDVLRTELEDRTIFQKFRSPVLLPIPISDKRRFERGWNQSELVCQTIKNCDKHSEFKYLPRQLVRFRHTESQTHTASRKERFENIKDSMRVANPDSVKDRCVIVIDDVLTTGATFEEAKRALKEAGAKKVLCVAIAH